MNFYFIFAFCWFVLLFEISSHSVAFAVLKCLCRPVWSQSHRAQPDSVSQVMGLEGCDTTPGKVLYYPTGIRFII